MRLLLINLPNLFHSLIYVVLGFLYWPHGYEFSFAYWAGAVVVIVTPEFVMAVLILLAIVLEYMAMRLAFLGAALRQLSRSEPLVTSAAARPRKQRPANGSKTRAKTGEEATRTSKSK